MQGERRVLRLVEEIRACRVCEGELPRGPRPVLRARVTARLLVVGQAPGTKVHETGIPWNDPSGERLRAWMGVPREQFYDDRQVAIVPMGFCYPGKGKGGDLPPRRECSALWHPRLLPMLTEVRLTLLIGSYAQAYFLGPRRRATLAETVRARDDYGPGFVPLPHPSPRNTRWLKTHAWFEREHVPALKDAVARALAGP